MKQKIARNFGLQNKPSSGVTPSVDNGMSENYDFEQENKGVREFYLPYRPNSHAISFSADV